MKILVILTGGTIGSKISQKTIDVNSAAAYHLIRLYQDRYGTDIDFEVREPMNQLSENLIPSDWLILLHALKQADFGRYDGIVITHGSDTLAYTAAMLGFCYAHTTIPIVLIASNYALEDARSNGLANFYNALCLIREKRVTGVFVVYQNDRKENRVYLPTRIQEADVYQGQFSSYGGVDFGRVAEGRFQRMESALNPTLEELSAHRRQGMEIKGSLEKSVLLLSPYPGLDYRCIQLNPQIGAVLHCTYHSSTVCERRGNYSAGEFVKRCGAQGIEVYACSFPMGENLYVTSLELLDAGAIPLRYISKEAAYVKLLLACNQNSKDKRKWMEESVYYEILPGQTSGMTKR